MINEIKIDDHNMVEQVINVIRDSHKTIADDFNLTKENAPGHTSFITREKFLWNDENKRYYQFTDENKIIGCAVLEKTKKENEYQLENLSILPSYRHNGYGKELVEKIIDDVTANQGVKINIGLIDEHQILKKWYLDLGFEEVTTKKFDHLPFTVCFMKYLIK